MSRHLLPRFDLHLGQIGGHAAQFGAHHPILAGAVLLAPVCAVFAVPLYRALSTPISIRLDASGRERVTCLSTALFSSGR